MWRSTYLPVSRRTTWLSDYSVQPNRKQTHLALRQRSMDLQSQYGEGCGVGGGAERKLFFNRKKGLWGCKETLNFRWPPSYRIWRRGVDGGLGKWERPSLFSHKWLIPPLLYYQVLQQEVGIFNCDLSCNLPPRVCHHFSVFSLHPSIFPIISSLISWEVIGKCLPHDWDSLPNPLGVTVRGKAAKPLCSLERGYCSVDVRIRRQERHNCKRRSLKNRKISCMKISFSTQVYSTLCNYKLTIEWTASKWQFQKSLLLYQIL